jgi:broad specificity phosphatase PhoE
METLAAKPAEELSSSTHHHILQIRHGERADQA